MVKIKKYETRTVCGGMTVAWHTDDTITVCNNTNKNWAVVVNVRNSADQVIDKQPANIQAGHCSRPYPVPHGAIEAEGHFTESDDDTCCVIC